MNTSSHCWLPIEDCEPANSPNMQLDGEPQYWLAQHMYVCPTHDGVVLLDLRHDKYLGLGITETRALAALVPGWSVHPDAPVLTDALPQSRCIEIAERAYSEGVLVRDRDGGKSAAPVHLTDAATLIDLAHDGEHDGSIAPAHVWNFAASWVRAAWSLRFRSMEGAVREVEERRALRQSDERPFDCERAAELTAVFRRIKPFFFTAEDRCLLHALALVNFLARYDLYPRWVMGVKMRPFAAHSWVQYERFTLDSTPEEICSYTPILAV